MAALELIIASHKDTYYAGLARLRIEELKKKLAIIATPRAGAVTASPLAKWPFPLTYFIEV
jgi:hypothetical protein